MKVFVLAPNENWILDRIAEEWKGEYPDLTTDNPAEADIIWLLSAWTWHQIPLNTLAEKKVVATIHHITPSKFTKDSLREFLMRDRFVDAYHVPCQGTKDFISKITTKPINIVGYWYNEEMWYPMDRKESREKLELPADKVIVGSFQRDTEGHDLKTPKLEKGPDLFFEYVNNGFEKDELLVLLGGWRRQYIIRRLDEVGIQYKYFEMAPIEKLKHMYSACDLYVVSSRVEGGPQAALEAAAMKVPIVSNDVGMVSDVLDKNCIFDISDKKYMPTHEDVENSYQKVQKFELKTHVKEYKDMFARIKGK